MKPLLGQVQNQAHLDDLLGSPKVKGGNFVPGASGHPSTLGPKSNEPSFTDLLLASIHKDNQLKTVHGKAPTPKIPNNLPQAERPSPKAQIRGPQIDTAEKPSDLAASIDSPKQEQAPRHAPTAQANSVGRSASQGLRAASAAATAIPSSLTPLQKQIGGKLSSDNLLNGNAILAFVTGNLDKLDPEALPSIVQGSLWIKEAVSSQDVSAFMETPMTIGDLSQLLELDQGLLNKASTAGLDPSKVVTPMEFLTALGLNPAQVTTELKNLQQRLPVEGIKPYIERARAAAAKAAGNDESNVDSKNIEVSQDSTPTLKPTELGDESAKPTLRDPVVPENFSSAVANPPQSSTPINMAQVNQNAANANLKPSSMAKAQVASPARTGLAGAIPLITSPIKASAAPIAKAQTFSDPSDSLLAQAMTSGLNIITPASTLEMSSTDRSNPQQNVSDLLTAQSPLDSMAALDAMKFMTASMTNGDLNSVGSLDSAGQLAPRDHFAEMGLEMSPESKINVDFGGNGTTQRSLQEHLLARGLNLQTVNQSQTAVSVQSAQASLQAQTVSAKNIGTMENASQEQAEAPSAELKTNPLQQNTPSYLGTNINPETQAITSLRDKSFGGGSFSDSEDSQDLSGQLSDRASNVQTSFSQGLQDSLGARDTDSITSGKLDGAAKSGPKETLSTKIFNHAQMMFKNGGGSMRLDMEAPGIGKINVAINLNNNNLDIRIITPSDQARDMITKEVTGLREGLIQQGISLRGLEVGKAGDSSSNSFAGQGHQQRGQSGQFGQNPQEQRASYNDMVDYVQSFKNTYAPRDSRALSDMNTVTNRWSSNSAPSTGSGRLEIRV